MRRRISVRGAARIEMRGVLAGVIALIAVLALREPAYADVRDEAGREFAAGEAADRRRDYATALRHYLRANELVPHPNAMFNIATNYERLGNVREAVIWYQRYVEEARDAPDRHNIIRKIRELSSRIPADQPTGTLRVVGPIGAMVLVDDAPVGPIPATIDLSPGTHAVRVTQPGFDAYDATIEVYPHRDTVVTARMTRALGAIGSPAKKIRAGYLFGVAGGLDLREQGPVVLVDLGVQALKYDIAARVGRANGFTAVDLVIRATLGGGRLAPYVGGGYSFTVAGGEDDGSTSTSGSGGGYAFIGGLRYVMSRSEHTVFALIAESGLRIFSSSGGGDSGGVMIPLMASVQLIYK